MNTLPICPSCGGRVGDECFNPDECAVIRTRMADRLAYGANMLSDIVASLEGRVAMLHKRLDALEKKVDEKRRPHEANPHF